MRILKVVSSNDKGGVLSCEMQFIKELKSRNIAVDIVILGNGASAIHYKQVCNKAYHIPLLDVSYGGPVHYVILSILKSIRFGYKFSRHLSMQMKPGEMYDAILYQRPAFMHLVGMLSQQLGVIGFWHLPNAVRTGFSRSYYNYFCKKYGVIQLANSTYTRDTLGGNCNYVVYPGYDSTRVLKGTPALREAFGINATVPVYGIAARMHEDKAQDLVVQAFICSLVPDAGGHLLIAGGPQDTAFAAEVQKKAGHLLQRQIHFLGEIDGMPDFYSSIDIFINGRRNVEPFGISIAEAMGAGKPVIAYKLGGPSEMVAHDLNGWLVDKPSVESYTEAFNLSLANRERWREMGLYATERASKFTVENNAKLLLDIIASETGTGSLFSKEPAVLS